MSKKSIFLIIFFFIIYFIFNSFAYSYSVSKRLKTDIFRLHIIANSDSKEDQELKLYIRDKLLDYLHQFSFNSKKELITFLNENKPKIENQIHQWILEKGFTYSATLEIGNSHFPQKIYSNINMPSGDYDGLKVKLGKASGKNWWCVLFPPMCLIDSTTCKLPTESEEILENSLDQETYSVLTSNTLSYKFKFKIVDIINNL